jgi:thiosulfate reductase cytochrome b subunit
VSHSCAPMSEVQTHPAVRRIVHWLQALAILVMIGSGWRIYDNDPIFPFRFPLWATLGGDPFVSYAQHNESGFANAVAWHFAAMWLLLLSFVVYLLHSALTQHFARDMLPLSPRAFLRDFFAALRFRLDHHLGEYNAVQKVFYWGVLFAVLMMILSGLAIWKPVQLAWLTWALGGFDFARVVHFFFMLAIVGFLVVHVALVVLVPKTFVAMTLGRATAVPHGGRS